MRNLIAGAAFAAVGMTAAGAQDSPTWLPGEAAVLRGLDKITAETRDFDAPVGEDVVFGALTIRVHKCSKRPPEEPPETVVGMEVFERATDGEGGAGEPRLIFSGWMFASSPALNALEHGVYDVWALNCRISETAVPETDPDAPAAPATESSE